MEVLLLLLEERGQLVTREQIVERIWGKDAFRDTDNSINGAIRKIRQVLKDDPEQPRFIQTVTGKGYRFIAPIVENSLEQITTTLAPTKPIIDGTPKLESATFSPSQSYSDDIPTTTKSNRRLWSVLVGISIVLIAGLSAYFAWVHSRIHPQLASGRLMLAVLPFENLTGDAGQEYFSDGMTEEMITQLGRLDPQHLGIIARTSVMHYKHSPEQLQHIGHELGVQYVLEGSVRRDSDKVRITAQLIQMKDQTHLWARQYDRELSNLLVLQAEIAQDIADEIQTALVDHKPIPPIVQPTLSPQAYEAYNLYLKGQYFWNKRTVAGFHEALGYFQQALAKDPTYARAYAGLADAYALIGSYSGNPPAEAMSKARAAALQALQLDDNLPEAHAALALIVQNYDYDWQTAEKEFKRAIELNPNYATAHHWYAEHLTWRGRFDEALRENELARELDPLSLIIATDTGATLYFSRQYDRAIQQFTTVREMDPDFPRAAMIASAYIQKGMFVEALATSSKRGSTGDQWYWAERAYLCGRAGQHREAESALKKLLDLNRRESVDPMLIVPAYIGIGNNDQGIAWLEKAYVQHSNGLTALKVDPIYDPLRNDPRFQTLMRCVGLVNDEPLVSTFRNL